MSKKYSLSIYCILTMSSHQKKRLFLGTYIDYSLFADEYLTIQDKFKGISVGKWVESDNLHFTYYFIGDFPMNEIDNLKSSLAGITESYNSEIWFKGLDCFPNTRNPRVLQIPVMNPDGMVYKLYQQIENVCSFYGLTVEDKPYKPHITLQRIKECNRQKIIDLIQEYKDFSFGQMSEFKIDLISSELTSKGPVYRIIQ
jgi:2'-5' RNA ligase